MEGFNFMVELFKVEDYNVKYLNDYVFCFIFND